MVVVLAAPQALSRVALHFREAAVDVAVRGSVLRPVALALEVTPETAALPVTLHALMGVQAQEAQAAAGL